MTQYLTEQKYPESNKSYQEIKNILQKILEIIPREEMIKHIYMVSLKLKN